MATPEAQLLLSGTPILTEGGLQTTLMYQHKHPLRNMATFEMLHDPTFEALLSSLHRSFAQVSIQHQIPLLLDMDTWRASANWYDELGTSKEHRKDTHRLAKEHCERVAEYIAEGSGGRVKAVVHGCVGPRKDAYVNDEMSLKTAREYHAEQMREMKEIGVGLVGGYTLSTSTEALAIALEAERVGIPCLISFTMDSNGLLPSGETLKEAVQRVDQGCGSVLFYMVNCVHPRHVRRVAEQCGGEDWLKRVRGVRGNASMKSHAELDKADELDRSGDAAEFARDVVGLKDVLPELSIVGGCCGTDSLHCAQIAKLLK